MEMRRPALQWAMRQRGGYLVADLKEHLATLFELTPDELTDDEQVFSKNVNSVTAYFTETGIHNGVEGAKYARRRYYLTRYGYAVGEGQVQWPTKLRHGPKGARPDPRQLPTAEGGLMSREVIMPDIPAHVGPAEFSTLGAMVAVRCPSDLVPLVQKAGGLWELALGAGW